MKKLLLLIIGLLLPIIAFAAPNPDDYTSMNLIEAINGEESLMVILQLIYLLIELMIPMIK